MRLDECEAHAQRARYHQPQEPRGPGVKQEETETIVSDGVWM